MEFGAATESSGRIYNSEASKTEFPKLHVAAETPTDADRIAEANQKPTGARKAGMRRTHAHRGDLVEAARLHREVRCL